MDTRREFLKKAALLSGAAGVSSFLPDSVKRALLIDPAPGSTYLDAEHIVVLMQENRAFDHCFGALQGVRGFNDPRASLLPNGKPVFFQNDARGRTYTPFRLDIADSKSTWMGDLPHSRASQIDADNSGRYDQWLVAKQSRKKEYAEMPLTLGYYTRDDLPFNYALADAFTVCDQNFCSAMTSTWPNRLYFWTGAIRDPRHPQSKAFVRNDLPYGEAEWKTFPERLEEHGVSWNVYQNDITCGGGFKGEERSWLSNFGCNPLELFSNYNVRFSDRYVKGLEAQHEQLPAAITELENKLRSVARGSNAYKKASAEIAKKQEVLRHVRSEREKWTAQNYEKLSPKQKSLHKRAFSKNDTDPRYHEITKLRYRDGQTERELTVPKGDVLHRFRQDVRSGKLPAVSWLVGPQNFSDHPSAPWYGALYVSDVLDILTENPEVWKKTIFILTYDENDGYYDHVPPFVPPDPADPSTGKCSNGIDTTQEYIRKEQEVANGISEKAARSGPIGLGFRVPLIIASPWTRGGKVCSQVFDHTSTLQFIEHFVNSKFGLNIRETNISTWRRAICGDLTAAFDKYDTDKPPRLPFLDQKKFFPRIHTAQFKQPPAGYRHVSDNEIPVATNDYTGLFLPRLQEKGSRPSPSLPYELYVDGNVTRDKQFRIDFAAGNELFGKRAAGSPFRVQSSLPFKGGDSMEEAAGRCWNYAVEAGSRVSDEWNLQSFRDAQYDLRVYGPNGFYRNFWGSVSGPSIEVLCRYEQQAGSTTLTGNIQLEFTSNDTQRQTVDVFDHYQNKLIGNIKLAPGQTEKLIVIAPAGMGWYDVSIRNSAKSLGKRFAGRVETGNESITDPAMAG